MAKKVIIGNQKIHPEDILISTTLPQFETKIISQIRNSGSDIIFIINEVLPNVSRFRNIILTQCQEINCLIISSVNLIPLEYEYQRFSVEKNNIIYEDMSNIYDKGYVLLPLTKKTIVSICSNSADIENFYEKTKISIESSENTKQIVNMLRDYKKDIIRYSKSYVYSNNSDFSISWLKTLFP